MNRDDIIRMAREAGIFTINDLARFADLGVMQFYVDELEHFAALVAAATRESMKSEGWRQCAVGQRETQHCGLLETAVLAERGACARVCDERVKGYQYETDIYASEHINEAKQCAAAIRARGEG